MKSLALRPAYALEKDRFPSLVALAANTALLYALLVSLCLCFFQYRSGRSLWLDEAFVAVGLRFHDCKSLFGRLSYMQQFPRFYLCMIYGIKATLGYSLWTLRLLPFGFAVAAVCLGTGLMKRAFRPLGTLPALLAVMFFLTNHFVYYYAGEFKQYSGDLFWSLFGCWYADRFVLPYWESDSRLSFFRGFFWAAPMLFSLVYPFVFFAAFVACALLTGRRALRNALPKLGLMALTAGIFLGIAYASDLRFTNDGGLRHYWAAYFIHGATALAWLKSLWVGMNNIVGRWWMAPSTVVFTLIGLFGAGRVIRKLGHRRQVPLMTLMGVILLLELLVLAAAQRYPLEYGRSELFFFPYAAALIVYGIDAFRTLHWAWIRNAIRGLCIVFVGFIVVWKMPRLIRENYHPAHWEDMTPALQWLATHNRCTVFYGPGSEAQVRACPQLPGPCQFVPFYGEPKQYLKSALSNPKGLYMFLYVTPNGDLDYFLNDLRTAGFRFHSRFVLPHLYAIER